LARILSVSERIRLFKEINRVHKEMYGWKMVYEPAYGIVKYIDIDRDLVLHYSKEWAPMNESDVGQYYFQDYKGKDIPSLWGIFGWQAYYFSHLNPYKFYEFGKKLPEEDFVSDSLGKKIRPNINHPVDCRQSLIEVQQRKADGKIWISSNWIYHPDCYGSGEGFGTEIYRAFGEASVGDEKVTKDLWAKYEEIASVNGYEFKKALEKYFTGGKLQSKYWDWGYLLAASKEWKIKTLENLNEAKVEEDKHFRSSLEEFIGWFRSNGINLGERAEEGLRRRMREFYANYPCNIAKEWCKLLVEEDNVESSDVYLWWGGEPNSDSCYAFLTLFFEVDPDEIGNPSFDNRVSRNLRAILNIADKDTTWLSSYRKCEPNVWRAIFS